MTEQFTFFWSGPFSNWHPSPFQIDGVRYNCSEQYMMAEKARMFNDPVMLNKIMSSVSPREQKAYGRQIKDFNADAWNKVARDVVYKGCLAKFTQNELLKNILLGTRGTTLVEASPQDCIWGIGLPQDDPRAKNRHEWLGTNWLGEILTKLREDFFNEAGT